MPRFRQRNTQKRPQYQLPGKAVPTTWTARTNYGYPPLGVGFCIPRKLRDLRQPSADKRYRQFPLHGLVYRLDHRFQLPLTEELYFVEQQDQARSLFLGGLSD